jgi:neutral ceramidase
MSTLHVGFGRAEITPKIGCRLVGYGSRHAAAVGVHDTLWARAVVLEDQQGIHALVACDLLFVLADTVAEVRAAVQRRVGIPPHHVFVAATHTHSGPSDRARHDWDHPLPALIADAVERACQDRRPARLGSGFGFLSGCSINRRWLDRPVDPAVAVLRVDDADGALLGVVFVFGCHAVVLGADNHLLSGDWPGHAAATVERALGSQSTCLVFQGGAGDVNPVVSGVRTQLGSGRPIVAIGNLGAWYGAIDAPDRWNIGDRRGGTFDEVAELGEAVAREVLHVVGGLAPRHTGPLWSERVTIDAALDPDEPRERPPAPEGFEWPPDWDPDHIPAEIMTVGAGEFLLVGQPGEPFSETAVAVRTRLRALGFATPALAGYANGALLYLPPPEAFLEGGYETNWARSLGISHRFQLRAWEAIERAVRPHALPHRQR